MIIKSLEQLNSLSKKVADQLKKNDYIFLIGEIGVGKTTFTRYLINYLQVKNGFKATTLGKSRLRTETAGIIATHSVNLQF